MKITENKLVYREYSAKIDSKGFIDKDDLSIEYNSIDKEFYLVSFKSMLRFDADAEKYFEYPKIQKQILEFKHIVEKKEGLNTLKRIRKSLKKEKKNETKKANQLKNGR